MTAEVAEARPRLVTRYQLDTGVSGLTPAERVARGKAARALVPRDSHAVFDPPSDRPDPIALLEEQAKSRVPELVPRHEPRPSLGYLCRHDRLLPGRVTAALPRQHAPKPCRHVAKVNSRRP